MSITGQPTTLLAILAIGTRGSYFWSPDSSQIIYKERDVRKTQGRMPEEIGTPGSHLVVLTTVAGEDDARGLIRGLVEDRVIACGTMVGANSIYRWEGAVREERETLVLLKTRRECWGDLEKAVKRRHPYEVPELLALPVEAGLDAYLQWVNQETSDPEAHDK